MIWFFVSDFWWINFCYDLYWQAGVERSLQNLVIKDFYRLAPLAGIRNWHNLYVFSKDIFGRIQMSKQKDFSSFIASPAVETQRPCFEISLERLAIPGNLPVVMPTPISTSMPPNIMNNVMLSARKRFPHKILKIGIK